MWAGFVDCFEESGSLPLSAAKACAKGAGLDWASLSSCAAGARGAALLAANARATAAYATDAATPAWRGTPTVTVAGAMLSDPSGLLAAVCQAYTGTAPKGCSSSLL